MVNVMVKIMVNVMVKRILLACVVAIFVISAGHSAERLDFNQSWKFTRGDAPSAHWRLPYPTLADYCDSRTGNDLLNPPRKSRWAGGIPPRGILWAVPDFDDSAWATVDLPHDWAIAGPFSEENDPMESYLPTVGTGWYRKTFTVSQAEKNRRFFLDIDGSMSYTAVFMNGSFCGGWPYGYTSFRVDLTPFIKVGAGNVVAIRVSHPRYTSRWYTGAGLYRHVWLTKSNDVHVAHWGVCIRSNNISNESARVNISASVTNETQVKRVISLKTTLYRRNEQGAKTGQPVAESRMASQELPGDKATTFEFPPVIVKNPALWSIEHPNMYVAETEVLEGNQVVDREESPFGIRSIEYAADRGFLLNGKHVKIQGACLHHDLGSLGAAVNECAIVRQLRLLREAGCNAIRLSHNPASPEMMDALDRLGFLVQAEAFDQWTLPGGATRIDGYCRLYDQWHEKDLRALVRRDRNHPSIIMWSIGNEIPELRTPEKFVELGKELVRIVREEDPTRPVTSACNNAQSGFNGIQDLFDIFGFNYYGRKIYDKFHQEHPSVPVYASETVSMGTSRGFYVVPPTMEFLKDFVDFHQSSYCWSAYSYNPKRPMEGWACLPDVEFAAQDKSPFVCGEFIWSGFDYLGAPGSFSLYETSMRFSDKQLEEKLNRQKERLGIWSCPLRICEPGLFDTAGFRKDSFYLYRSRWLSNVPTAYLLPHWNWPDRMGQIVPVHLFTSGDEAELFLNGRSLGKRKKGPFEYRLIWNDVVYEPGELKAVVSRKGKYWTEAVRKTTGDAFAIRLTSEGSAIKADGKDLAFITAEVVDKSGNVVPTAENALHFTVGKPGRLVATDNGDATDWTSYVSADRKAQFGLALAIVAFEKGTNETAKPGNSFEITATSPGLKSGHITINRR